MSSINMWHAITRCVDILRVPQTYPILHGNKFHSKYIPCTRSPNCECILLDFSKEFLGVHRCCSVGESEAVTFEGDFFEGVGFGLSRDLE